MSPPSKEAANIYKFSDGIQSPAEFAYNSYMPAC